MTANEARTHILYTNWASRRVLDAARQLSSEDLSRGNGISHESILGTLTHLLFADSIWYSRLDPTESIQRASDLATLEARWMETQEKWRAWSDSLSDADLERVVPCKSMDGQLYSAQVSQIVLHVVNHATLHRGQVVGMIRQLGLQPPVTDFMFYLREMSKAP